MKPVKASLHGAKRRFIFGGIAAKCFMRRKPRFIKKRSALPDEALSLRSNMKQLHYCSAMKHSAFASYDERSERMRVFPLVIDPA